LNEARRRLSKRQKTLQSVATSVGFTNTGAFQRAFEKRFGTRPSRLLASLPRQVDTVSDEAEARTVKAA
jgi:AraC-like DNA-binding protein